MRARSFTPRHRRDRVRTDLRRHTKAPEVMADARVPKTKRSVPRYCHSEAFIGEQLVAVKLLDNTSDLRRVITLTHISRELLRQLGAAMVPPSKKRNSPAQQASGALATRPCNRGGSGGRACSVHLPLINRRNRGSASRPHPAESLAGHSAVTAAPLPARTPTPLFSRIRFSISSAISG